MPPVNPICGAKTRKGTPCTQMAGARTGHPKTGRCWLHGGASPQTEAVAAQAGLALEARSMAMAVKLDPMDAMLHVVYGFAGRVQYLSRRGMDVKEAKEFDSDGRMHPVLTALRQAQLDLARVSHMALQAGVAERRVQMAERLGALISAAAEDSLADLVADAPPAVVEWLSANSQRGEYARIFERRLGLLESGAEDVA